MKIRSVLIGLLIVLTSSLAVSAPASEPNDVCCALLRERFNQERSGQAVSVFVTIEQLKNSDPDKVLLFLSEYEDDSHLGVRHSVYYYEYALAQAHTQPNVRHKVTDRLVKTLIDPNDHIMNRKATDFLLSFEQEDFSEQCKVLIREGLAKADIDKVGGDWSIWLCGVANVQDQLPRLKDLLIDELAYSSDPNMRHLPKWYYTSGWAARLARARMGVEDDIARCIQLVDSILRPKGYFEDRVSVPETRLLNNISYIAQPDAVKYLQGYLESDKKLMGPHGKPWEPVASYVLDLLASRLKDFPIERRRGRFYSRDEIEQARKWMVQQKEWKIIR